jgi:hypothetical protein
MSKESVDARPLTSVELLDAAVWREIDSDEAQPAAAFLEALSRLVGRWLLVRSDAPEMDAVTVLCKARGYIGSTQGTLRYDLISTNRPDSIAAFPRENTMIGAADMPCHWPPFWIYSPRHFPK